MVNNIVKIYKSEGDLKNKEISLIKDLISNVKYGSITLKIQNGVLIQIDTNERIRLR